MPVPVAPLRGTLFDLAEELDRACVHFLATQRRDAKLRVAKSRIRPVLDVLLELLHLREAGLVDAPALRTVHPFDVDVLEFGHFPLGGGPGRNLAWKVRQPRAVIHVGLCVDGRLASIVTTPRPPFWRAGPTRLASLGHLATIGIRAHDLVEQARRLAHRIVVERGATQPAAAA